MTNVRIENLTEEAKTDNDSGMSCAARVLDRENVSGRQHARKKLDTERVSSRLTDS